MLVMISNAFFDKIKHRSYRAGYIEEHAKTHVAYQVRALREEREWTQKEFADAMGTLPSVVSRIEDPDYGKLSMQTLFEIAAAFDVALVIDYVSFPEFVSRKENVSPSALSVPSFDEDQFLAVEESAQRSRLDASGRQLLICINK